MKPIPSNFVDRVGLRYGNLVVLEYLRKSQWLCLCDCGNTRIVGVPFLLNGHRSFLGCEECCIKSKSEKTKLRLKGKAKEKPSSNRSNLVGQVFGHLTVVGVGRKSGEDNGWKLYWRCTCVCGKQLEVSTGGLTSGNSKSCGCAKVKYAPGWSTDRGLTFSAYLRTLPQHSSWRTNVLQRDGFACISCSKSNRVDAHHIIYLGTIVDVLRIDPEVESSYSSFLWNTDNGVTLCRDCHRYIHTKVGRCFSTSLLSKHYSKFNIMESFLPCYRLLESRNSNLDKIIEILSPHELNYALSYLKSKKKWVSQPCRLNERPKKIFVLV